ncbi:hypothetical protein GX50_08028 [[Emmonsia] crescens]|uniref:Uncharacterized protein n=1 Tax=[Emmonsia] crescens TaxID=73230 RepID=A0A2B7Z8U9_9EURO|nr:hypothetical protein GX50_08028 [Emmonsia crescens]
MKHFILLPIFSVIVYLIDHLKEIERLSRLGGLNLSDLRNYPVPQPMSSRSSSHRRKRRAESPLSSNTGNTKTITKASSTPAYSQNFQQNLIDHRYPEKHFEDFREADAYAFKEKPVTVPIVPILDSNISDPKCVREDYSFENLVPLTDGTLASAKPDHFHGTHPEQLNHQIREELSSHIKQKALEARGMHSLWSYQEDESTYNTYPLTSTYHGSQLKLYTTHLAKPSGPDYHPKYIMTQLNTWDDSDVLTVTDETEDAQWSFAAPNEDVEDETQNLSRNSKKIKGG